MTEFMSTDDELVSNYLQTILIENESKPIFDPWLILQNLPLAHAVGQNLAHLIQNVEQSSICVLADSGIPLGVLVAQVLNVPIYFYRRSPWVFDRKGINYLLPSNGTTKREIHLVDSHIRTGYTASQAYEFLSLAGYNVKSIVAPLAFHYPITTLEAYRDKLDYNLLLKDISQKQLEKYLFNAYAVSHTKQYLHSFLYDGHKYENDGVSYLLPKKTRLLMLLRSLVLPRRLPAFQPPNVTLARKMSNLFNSSPSGIWELFMYPELLAEACGIVIGQINIQEYEVIIGNGYIGTIFALCVAYRSNFQGTILSTVRGGFVRHKGISSPLKSQRAAIFSGTLQSGYYLLATSDLLRSMKVYADTMVALRFNPSGVDLIRRRVLTYLSELKDMQIIVLSLQ